MFSLSRRHLLIGGLTLAPATSIQRIALADPAPTLEPHIADLERRHAALIGIFATNLNSAIPGDPRDTSTPEALGGGYPNLLAGDILAAPQRSRLEEWMRANQTSSMRAGLPAGWTSADKTGSGDYASTNDVGIAYGPDGQRILLALMIRTQTSDPNAPSLRPLIGEVTGLVLPTLLA